jgi:hypothetical protein
MLADHLAWIVAQDWVGDFYDEIRRVWLPLVGRTAATARHGSPGRGGPAPRAAA